jgi:hypothetical protein
MNEPEVAYVNGWAYMRGVVCRYSGMQMRALGGYEEKARRSSSSNFGAGGSKK